MTTPEAAVGGGFAGATTESLWKAHDYLLGGLDLVALSLENGTFHEIGPKGAAPPSQAGQLTLGLLVRCAEELAHRINNGTA